MARGEASGANWMELRAVACIEAGETRRTPRRTPEGLEVYYSFILRSVVAVRSIYRTADGTCIGRAMMVRGVAHRGDILAEAIGDVVLASQYIFNFFGISLRDGTILDCGRMIIVPYCRASMANDYRGVSHGVSGHPAVWNCQLVEFASYPGRVFVQALTRIEDEEGFVYYGTEYGDLAEQVPITEYISL
jgi:hypothetical protein